MTFSLATAAHVFALAGEREAATAAADELLQSLRHGTDMQFAVINLPGFAAAAERLGLGRDLSDALTGHIDSVWSEVVRAYAAHEFVAAADILERLGARSDEAEARLRAGEEALTAGDRAVGEAQLQRALEFFRSVGASRYIADCETLLSNAG